MHRGRTEHRIAQETKLVVIFPSGRLPGRVLVDQYTRVIRQPRCVGTDGKYNGSKRLVPVMKPFNKGFLEAGTMKNRDDHIYTLEIKVDELVEKVKFWELDVGYRCPLVHLPLLKKDM
jgi:hypothetical protein